MCSTYVHKNLNLTNDPTTKNKLLEFSLQLIHRKVEFSALGLFSLNRKLLFRVRYIHFTFKTCPKNSDSASGAGSNCRTRLNFFTSVPCDPNNYFKSLFVLTQSFQL